jgi:hypothetical protein
MSDLGAAQSTFKSASPEKIPPGDFFAKRQHPGAPVRGWSTSTLEFLDLFG